MSTDAMRDKAWALVCQYTANERLRRHMLAVEGAMRFYAQKRGEDQSPWGVVGLLHDFDYERFPNPPDHPLKGSEILRAEGFDETIIYAILSHADYMTDYPRRSALDHHLFACDELSGFVVAVAYVRPERLQGMAPSSVTKKMKQASFAANVSRDDIRRGAEEIGLPLDEHIANVIAALTPISDQLGLATP